MNTDKVRFEEFKNGKFKEDFGKLVFIGFATSFEQAAKFAKEGYQQGVKDSEVEAKFGEYPYQKTDDYLNHVAEIKKLKEELKTQGDYLMDVNDHSDKMTTAFHIADSNETDLRAEIERLEDALIYIKSLAEYPHSPPKTQNKFILETAILALKEAK